LTVFPCLLITGRAHDAIRVLYILKAFCPKAALLAGFDRSQLDVLGYYRTNLISEPNFDKRTANLLSCLTDKRFLVARGQYMARNSRSMAIYGGENPGTHRILNAIHIHMAPTHAALPDPPQSLPKMMKRVPAHLEQYRDRNLPCVDGWTWTPFGLSPETATIAAELGRCILDAPELRRRLLALLQIRDQDRLSEMSDTSEAIVLEATRALSRDEREQAYAREITVKANQLLEARGETMRLSPEKVGHQLKKLGLRTRPLSQRGHGLAFDKATVARINELAAMYMVDVMEDASAETGNFHSQQATEKK
jgi:hypothetical protein